MRTDTIEALEEKFRLSPFLMGGTVSREEIDQAAMVIGATFPEDYIDFLERFGGAIVGPYPIFGLRKVSAMGTTFSVVNVTNDFRQQNWRGTEDWVVFSEDHAGNPIGIAPDGKVWISDHDIGQVTILAECFEDYLRKKCLKLVDS